MDTIVPKRRGKKIIVACATVAAIAAAAAALWHWMPRGLQVPAGDLRTATVEQGVYRDDIVVRASTVPLRSVMLDSVESGRIEEVFARDGDRVQQGQLLFRIANPQRNLELLARQAEHAQQISNLSNLRVAQEASRSDRERRIDDLVFQLEQTRKQHERNARLAAQGYVSAAALEESQDKLERQQRALAQARQSDSTEGRVREHALTQLQNALDGLKSGLKLVSATVDALAVRAPTAGRLTDFHLQVGESITNGKHVGRIDDPDHFKLTAEVDEFYLKRVAAGRHGVVQHDGHSYAVDVATVYPQIKDGRFTVELVFTGAAPEQLSPGQSLDARIALGEPAPALLLPNGAYINDSGGAWVFVLSPGGATAERRDIRTGRRNNSQIEVLGGLARGETVIVSSYTAYGKALKLQISK
ncbi:efflux RND transporter periplasmic adaptor subunit [Duganella ginsengisoli]|uniref:Efflux RND transporter periplasmic adaptor subunit n=2 Tax=Pseudoduganella ginsengisoli TaxID=1462440 RepID=A0A6L6PY74_9BURK|nr:efflux RND transporter periplasmic adaptor subunit [Pseudoduganella ginsengisoli]